MLIFSSVVASETNSSLQFFFFFKFIYLFIFFYFSPIAYPQFPLHLTSQAISHQYSPSHLCLPPTRGCYWLIHSNIAPVASNYLIWALLLIRILQYVNLFNFFVDSVITKGHNGKPRFMALKDSTQERFQRYLTHNM